MYKNATVVDKAVENVLHEYPEKDYFLNGWGRGSDIITHYFFTCANRRAIRAIVNSGSSENSHYLYQFKQDLQWIETWIFGHGLLG